MDYDGAALSIISFFLASKVESVHISLEDILTKIGPSGTLKLPSLDNLFKLEIILVNTISFRLKIDLFYDVLYGMSLLLSSSYPLIFDNYTKALERLANIYSSAPGWWLADVDGPLLGIAAFSLELNSEQLSLLESLLQEYSKNNEKIQEITNFIKSSANVKKKDFDFKRIAMNISTCRLDNMESPLAKKIESIRELQANK